MKVFLGEILDPVKDFFTMRKRDEKLISILIPICAGILCFVIGKLFNPVQEFNLILFSVDIINQLLTILTLFISFSMAYLSILVTSGSKNVDGLKEFESDKYFLNGRACTLYQVLSSEITYTIIFEIFFMVLVLIERFILYFCDQMVIQTILSLDIALFVHVLLMMLIVIKNIYFSFWQSK